MDGSVFEQRRRERIAFLAKFGEARPWRRRAGLGRSKTKPFREKSAKKERTQACLDRTGASGAFFSWKSANYGVVAARQGLGAAKHHILQRKALKTLHQGADGSAFGPLYRRERSAFLAEIDRARHSHSKAGPRRSKATHFAEKGFKNTPPRSGRKCVWTAQA